jgi:hypothetical protein
MKSISWAGFLLGLAFTAVSAGQETGSEPNPPASQRLIGSFGVDAEATTEQQPRITETDEMLAERDESTMESEDSTIESEEMTVEAEDAVVEVQNDAGPSAKTPRARLVGFLTPQPAGTELAACGGCGHDWTDCCCNRCGWTAFGEWLLLQPRGADVLYAERALNCFTPPIGTEQIDFGAISGYKVGLARSLHDGCSEIVGTFTRFESVEEDRAVPTTGTDVLRPVLAFDPFVTCDDSTSTSARAKAGIDFERADVDYRAYIDHGCCRFDWLVGFGYGALKQDVQAIYDAGRVNVESDAWGYGVRLGGGTQYGKGCIRGFGHLDLTLLASNLKASYAEIDDGTGVVATNARVERDFDRIIPVLDLEVGLAVDLCKNTVLKCGYIYSIWYNVVTVPEYVESVQSGDLSGPSDTLTFDGVFARLEYAW